MEATDCSIDAVPEGASVHVVLEEQHLLALPHIVDFHGGVQVRVLLGKGTKTMPLTKATATLVCFFSMQVFSL